MYIKILWKIFFLFVGISLGRYSAAQDSLTWALGNIAVTRNGHEVGIGEKVPDIPMQKILNYNETNSSLIKLNSKPLIIEFWHQYCSVCRSEIPKLNTLYQQFKDSVQFLMVTFQSEASIKDFMQQQAWVGKRILPPIVVEDTLLRKTFGHDGDPHVVWIGSDGVVHAISNHLALSKEHITQWLQEKHISLALKSNQQDYDLNNPLLINNNGGRAEDFLYRSILTDFIDSIPMVPFAVTRRSNQTKILMTNATIDQLFKECYMRYDTSTVKFLDLDWKNKRIDYAYKDSSVLANWVHAYQAGYDQQEDFQRKHMYCYELILPGTLDDMQAAAYTLKELGRLFHIRPTIETKNVDGLALVRITKEDRMRTKGLPQQTERSNQDSVMIVQNNGIWSLVNILNLNYTFPYVTDETGYRGNVDIIIPFQKNNLELIKQSLNTYGLDLIPKKYRLQMLVLADE